MGDSSEFFKAMAPYLTANLLTVVLVYGYASYARLEREGAERGFEGLLRIVLTLMVLSFCLFGLFEWF